MTLVGALGAFLLGGFLAVQVLGALFLPLDLRYGGSRYRVRTAAPIVTWLLVFLAGYLLLPESVETVYLGAAAVVVLVQAAGFLVLRWLQGRAFSRVRSGTDQR